MKKKLTSEVTCPGCGSVSTPLSLPPFLFAFITDKAVYPAGIAPIYAGRLKSG